MTWRSFGLLLACLVLERSAAHPGCFPGGFPNAAKTALTFCPVEQFGIDESSIRFGACCTDDEEDAFALEFADAVADAGGELSLECAELHKQVVCAPCHSFAGHLYEAGNGDGLTMKRDFCDAYTAACDEYISFGSGYCEDQVGSASGDDSAWSFPYEQGDSFPDAFAEVFPGVSLPTRAYSMEQSPDGTVYFIGGHTGEMKKVLASDLEEVLASDVEIKVVPSSALMTLTAADNDFFTDYVSQTDEGLNHFAFSPNFAVNNYFYVSFNIKKSGESTTRCRLSKFTYNPSSGTAGSEEVLLETGLKISPYHPGGWVGFKPSSYADPTASTHDLYWSTGDGSQQEDRENLAQDLTNLLGAMIRIQVPSGAGTSGSTNPSSGNYGGDAHPAVCAIGFRNPWRCSFSPDGDLYCGDVGQYKIEEISKVECGKNYGWSTFEGSRCQSSAAGMNGIPECAVGDDSREGFTFPFYEYCHSSYSSFMLGAPDEEIPYTNGVDPCGPDDRELIGSAVIGGYWYKGEIFNDLLGGAYVFADYTNQNIYYLKDGNLGTIISDGSIQAVSFTEDINGELMVIDKENGIFHLRCGDLCDATPVTICPEDGLTFDGEMTLAQGESCLVEGTTFTFPASAIGSLPEGYSVSAVSDGINTAVAVESGQVSIFLIPNEGATLTVSLTNGGDVTDCNTVTVLPECGDIVDDPCAEPSPCGPDETCAPAAEPIPANADPYVCTPIGEDPCAEPSPCGPDETCAPAEEPVPEGADPYVCTPIGGPDGPFNGVPADVPGTIEAEEFDNGGPGVAYSDGDPNNIGGALRTTEEVDIGSIAGGGYNVGWTQAGEWMRYTVEVTEDVNPITFSFNVASPFTDLGKLRVVTGGTDCDDYTTDLSGEVVLPSTGGWNAFEDYTITGEQPLSAGETEIWLCILSPGFNIDSWTVLIAEDPCAEPSPCGPDETCAPAEEPVPAGADPYVCTPIEDPCAEPSPCGPDETCAPAEEPIPAGADPYVCTPIEDPCAEPSPCGPDETCAPAEEPIPAGADPYVCTPIEDPCAEPSPCGPDETCAPAEEPVPAGADPYVCTPIGGPDGPFNGVPADIPGTIEAEEFDDGGPGVAYSDGDPNNIGGALRTTEEVDIGSIAGGGFFVGWTQAGEWMRYTVEVTEDVNPITFSFNVASPFTDLGKLRVVTGGTDCDDYTTDLSGEVVLPSTGGWNAFEDYTITGEQPLSAGETEIWLCIISPGFNIDSWTVSPTT